jgi:hypothetical protein
MKNILIGWFILLFFSKTKNLNFSVINNSPHVEDPDLRVSTNLFGEFQSLGDYPVYFTDKKSQ